MHEAALLDELELLELEELLDEELLDEELLEELLEEDELPPLLPPEPPQAARNAAAPPEASQPSICRRWRICTMRSRSPCKPGCSCPCSWDGILLLMAVCVLE
jgi:hypothetical protein